MRTHLPILGVGVFVINAKAEVLLGKRINTERGAGQYQIFGGHLEDFESVVAACHRELMEEVGIDVTLDNLHKIIFTDIKDLTTNERYVTFYYYTQVPNDIKFVNKEPDKCEDLKWVPIREACNMNLFCDSNKVLKANFIHNEQPETEQPHPCTQCRREPREQQPCGQYHTCPLRWPK